MRIVVILFILLTFAAVTGCNNRRYVQSACLSTHANIIEQDICMQIYSSCRSVGFDDDVCLLRWEGFYEQPK